MRPAPNLRLRIAVMAVVTAVTVAVLMVSARGADASSFEPGKTLAVGDVFSGVSMQLDSAGRPVVSYSDDDALHLLRCDDPACTAHSDHPLAVDGRGAMLRLNSQDLPVVAFHDGEDIHAIACNDPACVGDDEAEATVVDLLPNGDPSGETIQVALELNGGHPVVAYHTSEGQEIGIAICGSSDCTGPVSVRLVAETSVRDNGTPGHFDLGLVNGRATIAYGYNKTAPESVIDRSLRVVACRNVECTGRLIRTELVDAVGRDGYVGQVSLATDDDGMPVIAWSRTTRPIGRVGAEVIHCADAQCQAVQTRQFIDAPRGFELDMVATPAGGLAISYEDIGFPYFSSIDTALSAYGPRRLVTSTCDDAGCKPAPRCTSAMLSLEPEIGIGVPFEFTGVFDGLSTAVGPAGNLRAVAVVNAEGKSRMVLVDEPDGLRGYFVLEADGDLSAFGDGVDLGSPTRELERDGLDAVDVAVTPGGCGYYVLDGSGKVYGFGGAPVFSDGDALPAGERAVSIATTDDGAGYWIFGERGTVLPLGNAVDYGDWSHLPLNCPIVDATRTASGNGYYGLACDGGVFTAGDAEFSGSTGNIALVAPANGIVADPDGHGYWFSAFDGGVFAFDAEFHGSMGGQPLNEPVIGLTTFGDGYMLFARDGGVFNFDNEFLGSLGGVRKSAPVVGVAAFG